MLTGSFLAILGISILVIVSPGPDTAMTIRGVMLGGRRGGLATAAGVARGQVIWALATAAGLVAVLLASEPVFQAIKLLGAAYLVYLGTRMLWGAWRHAGSGGLALRPALARLGHLLDRPRIRRSFEAVTGSLLVAPGARLASEQRG